MSEVNNIVPQAGRTDGPESRPIDKMGCPTDSGGGIQSTQTDDTMRGPREIGLPSSSAGPEYGENPFKRRSSLMRTPPRPRTNSLPDLNETLISSRPSKKKRVEAEKLVEHRLDDEDSHQKVFKDTLEEICMQVRRLEKVLNEMYKPKLELKEVAGKLSLQVEKLQSKEMKEWVSQKPKNTSTQDSEGLKIQIEELRKQLAENEPSHASFAGNQVQCENCKEKRRKEDRRRQLTPDDSYDSFKLVTEEDWNDEIFPKLRSKQGNIWEASGDHAVILPCDKNFITANKMVARAIDRFGGKDDLLKQGKKKGEVAMMLHSLGFPDETGNFANKSRVIYYPITSDDDSSHPEGDEWTLEALKKIRDYAIQHNTSKLAIPELEGVTGIIIHRMIEFVFAKTNIETTVYKERAGQAKITQGKSKPKQDQARSIKPKRPRQEALLVKMPNVKYADLLKTVKQAIDPTKIGVEVKEVKKTRNGELLLTVQNGAEKLTVLKNEINSKLPEANTSHLKTKKVLHVKDIDEVTTVEEIREAILKETLTNPSNLEVKALRPAYGSRQNVTVILPEADALKLVVPGYLRIGWTKCRVLERKTVPKCFKCWAYGHTKTQCGGPDREKLCLKCGKEGHKAGDCKNPPFCVHCNKEGHQSGSPKCPANNKNVPNPRAPVERRKSVAMDGGIGETSKSK